MSRLRLSKLLAGFLLAVALPVLHGPLTAQEAPAPDLEQPPSAAEQGLPKAPPPAEAPPTAEEGVLPEAPPGTPPAEDPQAPPPEPAAALERQPEPPPVEGPPLSPLPERPRRVGGGVSFGRTVIEEDEVAEDVSVVGGDLVIDGEVEGDASTLGGDIVIRGSVRGSVTAVGGDVRLVRGAEVRGDVTTVGGEIDREHGARIRGEETELRSGPFGRPGDWLDWSGFDSPFRSPLTVFFDMLTAVGVGLLEILFLSLFACLILLVARTPVERISRVIRDEPLKAPLVGIAAAILGTAVLFLVCLLLIATIVGCALVPVVFLLALILSMLAYTAAAYRVGRWLRARFGWRLNDLYLTAVVGILAIEVWWIAAEVLAALGWVFLPVAALLFLTGFTAQLYAWMAGLGALALDALDRRTQRAAAAAAAPPPVS